jgi:hypothetical protein
MRKRLYFRLFNKVKPSKPVPSVILSKEIITISYSFHTPFQILPLNNYNPLPDSDLLFIMDMEINNPYEESIQINKDGTLVNKESSVQITYYVRMIIQYSSGDVIETSRSVSGPYKRTSIPVSDFEIPHFLNTFHMNDSNYIFEIKPYPVNLNGIYKNSDTSSSGSIEYDYTKDFVVPGTPPLINGNITYSYITQESDSPYEFIYTYTFTSGYGTIQFYEDLDVTYMIVGGGGKGQDGQIVNLDTISGGGGNGGQVITNTVRVKAGTYNIGVGNSNESSYFSSYTALGNYSGGSTSSIIYAGFDIGNYNLYYGNPPSDGTVVTMGNITYQYGAGGGYGGLFNTNVYDSDSGTIVVGISCPGGYNGGGNGESVANRTTGIFQVSGLTPGVVNTGGGGGGGGSALGYDIIYGNVYYKGIGAQGGSGVVVLYFKI